MGDVATVLLVRHGLTAVTGPVLAGRTPGIHLDDRGRRQAEELAGRLAGVPLAACVCSPLERCQETATAIAATHDGMGTRTEERLTECGYGDWTGRRLSKLSREPLWRVVQAHPSAARFPGPGGESLADVQHRAVAAVRDWNATLGAGATYLACSHADVIKLIVADALGMHLDQFQRLQVDPCSVTVVHYTDLRPFVVRLNDTGSDLGHLAGPPQPRKRWWGRRRRTASDATPGGGDGQ